MKSCRLAVYRIYHDTSQFNTPKGSGNANFCVNIDVSINLRSVLSTESKTSIRDLEKQFLYITGINRFN